MPKPSSWLLIACLGAAAGACHRAPGPQAATPQAESIPVFDAPSSRASPANVRLAIQLIAAREPAHLAPAAPPATEPSHDLYEKDDAGRTASADPSPSDAPGFRITVPMCQKAERQSDPLAKTDECAQLLDAARDQARACKQAFENGDDKYVLSPACRQAAGFR